MLSEYFTEMTEEIMATDGVLDKFIGDAIMAFWGAPIDQSDQADRALKAAIGMMTRLTSLQKSWEERGLPFVDIGIGINSGHVIVGNMGSHKRFDYTILGDTVNAASRLESLNKEYKSHIIISETTKNKLTIPLDIIEIGEVLVKGKTKNIKIYKVNI
jgi:adenylate cyclase